MGVLNSYNAKSILDFNRMNIGRKYENEFQTYI